MKSICLTLLMAASFVIILGLNNDSSAAGRGQPTDWNRFRYYPYLYYPHNFQRPVQSYNHLYYRYPQNRQIPVYNKMWYNFYPSERPYHYGHHFILDII